MKGGFKPLVNPGTMSDEVSRDPGPEPGVSESFTITLEYPGQETEGVPSAIRLDGTINDHERHLKVTHTALMSFIGQVGLIPLIRAFNEVTDDETGLDDQTAVDHYEAASALHEEYIKALDSEDPEAIAKIVAEAEARFGLEPGV